MTLKGIFYTRIKTQLIQLTTVMASSTRLEVFLAGSYFRLTFSGGCPGGLDPCLFSIQSKLCPQILKPI